MNPSKLLLGVFAVLFFGKLLGWLIISWWIVAIPLVIVLYLTFASSKSVQNTKKGDDTAKK